MGSRWVKRAALCWLLRQLLSIWEVCVLTPGLLLGSMNIFKHCIFLLRKSMSYPDGICWVTFLKTLYTHWGSCVSCWFPENTTPTTCGWSKYKFITYCNKEDYHLDRVFVASWRGEEKDKRYLWGLRSVLGEFFFGGR